MKPKPPAPGPVHPDQDTLAGFVDEAVRKKFEAGWRAGKPRPIEEFLPQENLADFLPTVAELIAIEREFLAKQGRRTSLEDYLRRFPLLEKSIGLPSLIQQDFRLREGLGEMPSLSDYQTRFPDLDSMSLTGNPSEDTAGVPAADGSLEHQILAPPQSPEELGRLGNYRVLRLLGQGGMGVVYLAQDVKLRRQVALKAMQPSAAAANSAGKRFLREARALAALKHDHIATIYQVEEERGVPFLAMEFLEGESLEQCLKRDGKVPCAEVLRLARQIADGLATAHDHGLIHRDIKPGNIWLEQRGKSQGAGVKEQGSGVRQQESSLKEQGVQNSDEGKAGPKTWRKSRDTAHTVVRNAAPTDSGLRTQVRAKILDFGLARATASENSTFVSHLGMIIGTPAYMSPEQGRGETVDARADLFSLGCVLYQMVTGNLPFVGKGAVATMLAAALQDPPAPHMVDFEIPIGFSDLVMKLLAKKPEDRYASAHELVAALDHLQQEMTRTPLRRRKKPGPPSVVSVKNPSTGNKRIYLVLMLAILGMVALVLWAKLF